MSIVCAFPFSSPRARTPSCSPATTGNAAGTRRQAPRASAPVTGKAARPGGRSPPVPLIHRGPWPACDAQQELALGPPTPGTCSLVLEQLTTCLPRGPPCISPPSRWLPFSALLACSRTQRACFFLPPARLGAPLPHLGAPSAWPYHSSSAHCPFPSFRPGQPPHPKPYTHSLLLLQAQLPPTMMSPSPTEGRTSGQASAGEPTRPPAAWGGLSGEDDVTFSGVLAAGLCTRQAGRPSPD